MATMGCQLDNDDLDNSSDEEIQFWEYLVGSSRPTYQSQGNNHGWNKDRDCNQQDKNREGNLCDRDLY